TVPRQEPQVQPDVDDEPREHGQARQLRPFGAPQVIRRHDGQRSPGAGRQCPRQHGRPPAYFPPRATPNSQPEQSKTRHEPAVTASANSLRIKFSRRGTESRRPASQSWLRCGVTSAAIISATPRNNSGTTRELWYCPTRARASTSGSPL